MPQIRKPPTRGEMPSCTRLMPVQTVDAEKRTADLVWTTGARVRRYDWYNGRYYWEELSTDEGACDLSRLQAGAPLLNTHWRYSLGDVIGVVESASIDGKEGRAVVRFSERDDVEPIFRDVQSGIVRNVSVGYAITEMDRIPPSDAEPLWIYRAVRWQPFELSLVPVGADAGAGVRSASGELQRRDDAPVNACVFNDFDNPADSADREKEGDMPKEVQAEATAAKDKVDETRQSAATQPDAAALEAARAEGARRENERQAVVRQVCDTLRLEDSFRAELLADTSLTVDQIRAKALEQAAKVSDSTAGRSASIHTVRDETSTRRSLMSEALEHRARPLEKLSDGARQYRGMDLLDMARECIEAAGGSVRGLSKREVAIIALNMDRSLATRAGMASTSDFPEILATTIGRTLRQAYSLAPRTFTPWCRPATAPDFRQVARTQLSEMTKFQSVNEGGEYKIMSFGDSAEKYSLGKYGGIIALTWESVINDDLGAFARIPQAIAEEAAATESDIVYGILTGNPNMADTVALFHSTHGNLAGSAAAISDTSLGLGRAAMRKQTGPKGRVLNITPDFLIVGPDKEAEANKYTSAQFVAAKASDINPNFNTSLEVVVDARLTGNQWYLAARPARIDTIEYAYLEGEEGLFIERQEGFEVDGLKIKARHVFAAKAIDWRGLYKNAGA